MQPPILEYPNILSQIDQYRSKERTDSAAFLMWFLANVMRLDEIAAVDSVCDGSNDKGIHGLIIDHRLETIFVLQSKLKQNPDSTLGDTELKEFDGTLKQLNSEAGIQALIDSKPNRQLL